MIKKVKMVMDKNGNIHMVEGDIPDGMTFILNSKIEMTHYPEIKEKIKDLKSRIKNKKGE